MKHLYIYCISDNNGIPKYIGKTTQGVNRRIAAHLQDVKHRRYNMPIHNWLRQHPDFQVHTLYTEKLDDNWQQIEQFWIAHFKQLGFKLLNATNGGEGGHGYKRSAEGNQKCREALLGRPRPEDVRRRISLAHKGKPVLPETRKKISATLKARNHRHSDEYKLARGKVIYQYDLQGNFIAEYPTLTSAANAVGGVKGAISAAALGYQKRAKGFTWSYNKI